MPLPETFTDRRDDGAGRFGPPVSPGAYAGDLTQLAWRHDRNLGDVVVGTTLSFGFSALFNIGRELTGLAR